MKLVRVLDQEANNLVADPINQTILKELVTQQQSISELSQKLDLPTLKLWRRMQKLLKANLAEQTGATKVGNLEKKLYRSTAAWFVPKQYFNFKPKDPALKDALEIYSNIHNRMMAKIAAYNDIPKDVDPVDFSVYANMQVFAEVCGTAAIQEKIAELQEKLTKFKEHGGYDQ
jgi:hypothetical protein